MGCVLRRTTRRGKLTRFHIAFLSIFSTCLVGEILMKSSIFVDPKHTAPLDLQEAAWNIALFEESLYLLVPKTNEIGTSLLNYVPFSAWQHEKLCSQIVLEF